MDSDGFKTFHNLIYGSVLENAYDAQMRSRLRFLDTIPVLFYPMNYLGAGAKQLLTRTHLERFVNNQILTTNAMLVAQSMLQNGLKISAENILVNDVLDFITSRI